MVVAESKSRRRHRMHRTKHSLSNLNLDETKRSLSNLNPDKTKRSLPNLNHEEGIGCLGLNGRCQI